MPFLLTEILNFQGSTHLIGVGSFSILVENNRVYKLGGWEFLDIANKLFDNEKQVDWGSYAYQCTKEQLAKLMEQTGCEIDKINELASEKIYGIVFVEGV